MKEKKREEDETAKTDEFYYEIVGIFASLIAIIVFSELGAVGFFLRVFLKIFFGDWYFIIVIFVLSYGIYITWKRKFVDYKSRRFIGFYIFMVCVLTLSHFPINDFLKRYTDNTLVGTWELFVEYLKNYDDSLLMGGGIIGALGFFLFSFLLGELGVILICIILIIFSFAFMLERSITDLFTGTKVSTHGIVEKFKNIDRLLRKPMPKKTIKTSNKRLPISLLKDSKQNKDILLQNNIAIEYTNHLKKVLKYNSIGAEILNVLVGNTYTRFELRIYTNLSKLTFNDIFTNEDIYFEYNNSILVIETKNHYVNQISLKELINYRGFINHKNLIPIGFDINNQRIEIDVLKSNMICFFQYNVDLIEMYLLMLRFKFNKDEYLIRDFLSVNEQENISFEVLNIYLVRSLNVYTSEQLDQLQKLIIKYKGTNVLFILEANDMLIHDGLKKLSDFNVFTHDFIERHQELKLRNISKDEILCQKAGFYHRLSQSIIMADEFIKIKKHL